MRFNRRTLEYLKDMGAVLEKSGYEVVDVDFVNLIAHVNKIDHYIKRNGKHCKVEHHFTKKIPFDKSLVRYGKQSEKRESNDWSVGDRETYTSTRTVKFLDKETKLHLASLYNKY